MKYLIEKDPTGGWSIKAVPETSGENATQGEVAAMLLELGVGLASTLLKPQAKPTVLAKPSMVDILTNMKKGHH